MSIDPMLLKELIATFQSELAEQSQLITNDLLRLEKGISDDGERKAILDNIFRGAHNLKGASRGLGIVTVGEIAHELETLFSDIIHHSQEINHDVINVCLEAIDKMQSALQAFIDNKPLPYDLKELLGRISLKKTSIKQEEKLNMQTTYSEPESVRIQIDKIDALSSISEELQVSKIEMSDHDAEIDHLQTVFNNQLHLWKTIYARQIMSDEKKLHEGSKTINQFNDFMIDFYRELTQLQQEYNNKTNSLKVLVNHLQDEIGRLRLVPASVLLYTLPRYLRDLGNDLHKDADLDVQGEDVKIDKLVLDGLKDPINHLLRNALDHGIEEAAIRKAANKPERGRISIHFKDMGSEIIISIADDGAGLDTRKIALAAESHQLATKEELQAMSEADIQALIFRPGFSTKEVVTEISGRGVGLDVVKSNLISLKGHVSVQSIPGQGTTFILRVPLTLSSERGLLVKCGDHQFVMPTSFIKRVMMLKPSDLIEVTGGQAIMVDEHPIPYCSLANVLALPNTNSSFECLPTVVVYNSNNSVALLVDKIIGEREIVVKSFQKPLNKIDYAGGATLLDHNQLAVVLNIDDLVRHALNIQNVTRIEPQDNVRIMHEKTHILVVDDSITTRTLEKNVLENKNYRVTTAVNGQEAWDLLQKQKFSLMITDISMPIMDGFTLTERVKNSEKLRDLPIIIVTSLGSDTEKARGMEVGANAYVIKSEFESGALLDIIAQLV